jgi:hypothetical protein
MTVRFEAEIEQFEDERIKCTTRAVGAMESKPTIDEKIYAIAFQYTVRKLMQKSRKHVKAMADKSIKEHNTPLTQPDIPR